MKHVSPKAPRHVYLRAPCSDPRFSQVFRAAGFGPKGEDAGRQSDEEPTLLPPARIIASTCERSTSILVRHTDDMRTLSVQFQPSRAVKLRRNTISDLMLRIALDTNVRSFSMKRSRARDAYFNFLFESPTVARTWRAVHLRALGHRTYGRALRRSTIVVCQGSRGWDNYRLLHHFDPKKALDSLAGV